MSRGRSLARRYAMQSIFQWQLKGQDEDLVDLHFIVEKDRNKIDRAYFEELVHQVVERVATLDDEISPLLDRPILELDPVERAVLRLGTYEFMCKLDVPYRVVINEAVELCKRYGAENSHKYINGVLDKLAKKLRSIETSSKAG